MIRQRGFLKDKIRRHVDFETTAQSRGLPMPPVEKPFQSERRPVRLPEWRHVVGEMHVPLSTLIEARKSVRRYADQPLTIVELSYLLWATQGVRKATPDGHAWRNVPSAGNRHTFETYVAARRVDGLDNGIYLYRPLTHELLFVDEPDGHADKLSKACYRQAFAASAPATFIWTTLPERMEWRYGAASAKVIALDAGHVCQNLYLAAQSIGCGTCAIAAYDQDLIDAFVQVDGSDEFVVYIAPVGHLPASSG